MAEQLKSVNNTQQRLQGAGANLLEGVAVALDGLGLALGAVKKAATTGLRFGAGKLRKAQEQNRACPGNTTQD